MFSRNYATGVIGETNWQKSSIRFILFVGKEAIEKITLVKNETLRSSGAPRIDPKFVNNYELSDIQFRVEGRIYYAHKLGRFRYFLKIDLLILMTFSVLITSSSKFRSMLNSKFCEGSPPVLQINDIRYEIFDTVSQKYYQKHKKKRLTNQYFR